ncbi:serine/threonine-protein kinase ATR [Phalaenopsis equestris]|uniref:serine/threonine-protein kinase ATR n=1 Tax=Phalaenopsis equestris TaxID=78828 RepID=UPI0009E65649|nr:serine/threonine-protein kinase ATR [Phalaenopsis equestris]XP_020579053.1 serine/threonine-protein kinase ATR [Phalaenopsis equestris]XP_020579054.1 serine/threonine-protein kinase ATR [Phalaenopsis equestris]
MANLSILIHELRERIAASSSSSLGGGGDGDEDPLESRFRVVLPNLLHAYVVPSSSAKEREVTAVLKLLSHTARNFPGVFFYGKAAAVLPVIGRVLPFLAEPTFRSLHELIFETASTLLSLLRTGERDAYCQFFQDAMQAVEDIAYVAYLHQDMVLSRSVSLRCFCETFALISTSTSLFSEIPACCQPEDGAGIAVDLGEKTRWQSFAAWIIRLLSKCLTDGTLYVEGLVNTSFVSAACYLLCHGDGTLHTACFEFVRITMSVVDADIIPVENFIRSIVCILQHDEEEHAVFRNLVYDSSVGACFHVLHSTCQDEIVKSTASEIVRVFPKLLQSTESTELQVALCSAYIRIAKICPINIWKPAQLIRVLSSSKPCLSLIECIQMAACVLDSFHACNDYVVCQGISCVSGKDFDIAKVGEKRSTQSTHCDIKRQKLQDIKEFPIVDIHISCEPNESSSCEDNKKCVNDLQITLSKFIDFSRPENCGTSPLRPETSITALSLLSTAFCLYPKVTLATGIFQQVFSWIPWMCQQEKATGALSFGLSIYLVAIHNILLLQGSVHKQMVFFKVDSSFDGGSGLSLFTPRYDDLIYLLKLAWTNEPGIGLFDPVWKIKCLSIQVLSKLGPSSVECKLEVLDMAINDETEQVRVEAAISLPVIILCSGHHILESIFQRLESICSGKSEIVGRSILYSLGYLSCLYNSCAYSDHPDGNSCHLFITNNYDRHVQTIDLLSTGFWCSKCDKGVQHSGSFWSMPKLQNSKLDINFDRVNLPSIFLQLLYKESSEAFLVAYVTVLPRILKHADQSTLLTTKYKWIECIDYFLLHKMRAVREAFSTGIICFVDKHILEALFMDGETSNKTKEQKFLDRMKHALAVTQDPLILMTVLETIAEIMNFSDCHEKLFLYSLVLFVDQLDNENDMVRLTASRLIHRSPRFNPKGGFEAILSKFFHIRDGLFEYLSARLVSRPTLIHKFAETVFGIKAGELVGRMVPFVIPQLIASHKVDDHAMIILHELASHLDTDVVPLIVNWLPKVLAFALLHEDGEQLTSVLEFYHFQTGSDKKEIFSAALPALIDELLCFPVEEDMNETERRTTRISAMIQEVSVILTGSVDLPAFLKNHFVRLLNSIDRKMLRVDDLQLQKQALRRIEKLIEMMGSFLSAHVPKIMVLLLYAIDKEDLQYDSLSVLQVFINKLAELSPSTIKHVISQIVAAFIPCLERHGEVPSSHLGKIVAILEDLVVKNGLTLRQQIRELPLLPTVPALSKVNMVIQGARGSMTLRENLQDVIDGLNHESLNVRYMVACELSKLLNTRREDVTVLVAGEATPDLDLISSLITSLFRGCAEQSRTTVGQRLKLVCADCLGAVGAVDPAKFKGVASQRFKIECSDDDLIFELINKHLARAFRAASDTIVQDSAALAIQELLKLAGCQASLNETTGTDSTEIIDVESSKAYKEMNKRGQIFWDRFSNYIKEIIAPCLTSRFQLPNITDSASLGPIYHPSMSFRRWIFCWIRKLTAHATGSRFSIFSSCRGIVRHDMQTATYLLPYLVLNAVCHSSVEVRCSITEEILSVLNAAASGNSGGGATFHGVFGGQNEVCIQAVFTLIDNLGQWVDDLKQEIALSQSLGVSTSKQTPKGEDTNGLVSDADKLLVQCSNVYELLSAIPKVTLAKASFRCHAHARALMYFESHVRENSGSFNPAAESSGFFSDEDISFLMEIYSVLDEPDGLSGLANLRKSSTLQDQLLINEKAGNWAEVLTFCEQALRLEPDSIQRHSGVLNCLLNMCHLQAMVTHVDGLIFRIPDYKKSWCMQGVQAAWRLGRWDLMEEYLSGAETNGLICGNFENNASFDIGLAKIFQAMMKKDQFLVAERIAQSKHTLLVPLAAAGMDSYMRAYPYVVKLHLLCELEDYHTFLGEESFLEKSFSPEDPKFAKIITDWEHRLKLTQPSLWAREPLLALRRLVFGASGLDAQVGNCWLQYAKLCRSSGHYETAHRAILEAHASGAPNVNVEKAKLLWSTKKSDSAIAELEQCLLNMHAEVLGNAAVSSLTSLSLGLPNPPLLCSTQASKENQEVAKIILLYTRWIHHTGQKQKEDIINLYSRVRELQPKWENAYFFMAKYLDDLHVDARKRQEDNLLVGAGGSLNPVADEKPWWSHLPDVLLFYAKGLHRGHKNLFQALPRLLTLWFEFGSMYHNHRDGASTNKSMKAVNSRVLSIMRGCLKDLPTYHWLTVLSQLVSRICHQNEETVKIVKHIITSVLQEYPQQALWMMAAVSKSTVAARRDAASEIIQAARKGFRHGNDNSNLFVQFAGLIDHLIKLCFHPGQPKARKINISTEFSALKRMMPLGIILPIQQALTVTLPSYDSPGFMFSAADHPTISGIADEAEILSSLQRPKKVIFLGSDGVHRAFLCKPKDDLRKDARMMEFTAMINRLLSKFPESRRRKLYIRTFAVIPFTEDCGMVEWVPQTRGLRHILQDIYITRGKFDRQRTNPLIKKIYEQCQGKMAEEEMFKSKILPMFPPIFHQWFLTTFSEPAAWFRARVAYAHTTAVWSMVGHIVGLGDRHGENILFDSTTGDCVHVDFSCLFDKGLQLEKPELVPFRLTQNMIDGLGITGYEGVFLKVCEITLSVLRTHKETLMSVLETFIHDPLVEWTKSHKSSGIEVQNPHAQRAISNIKARLEGVVVGVGAAPSLPLAVEGQARRLIAEAVSHKNLGKMYIWWMPWF